MADTGTEFELVDGYDGKVLIVDESGYDTVVVAEVNPSENGTEATKRIAKLLSAAPRLLAVLKKAQNWHGELTPCDEPDDGLRGLLMEMQSAIADAE